MQEALVPGQAEIAQTVSQRVEIPKVDFAVSSDDGESPAFAIEGQATQGPDPHGKCEERLESDSVADDDSMIGSGSGEKAAVWAEREALDTSRVGAFDVNAGHEIGKREAREVAAAEADENAVF